MAWVIVGHGYSQFMSGQVFSTNWLVSQNHFHFLKLKLLKMIPQTQFFDPINGFMSSGAFAVVANEFVSVDSFFLIGDQ